MTLRDRIRSALTTEATREILRWAVGLVAAIQDVDWDRVEQIRQEAGDEQLLVGLYLMWSSETGLGDPLAIAKYVEILALNLAEDDR